MKKIYLIDGGKQVVCLPGATLHQLEKMLQRIGREPHSVIGSSCIGASVLGGVCNNSGGALVRRGPAYTEMSAYAHVDNSGRLHLTNHLGIQLGYTAEDILSRLDQGNFSDPDIIDSTSAGSDHHYAEHVRRVDENSPARFNADPRRLYEASGSAGKVMVFAVRLDTFPIEKNPLVFYIGTNHPHELTDIRRHILTRFEHLPISGEYLHRDAFAIAHKYGKDTFLVIRHLGTACLPILFSLKARCDALFDRMPFLRPYLTDRVMQGLSRLFPDHLPPRIKSFHQKHDHHLILKVSAESGGETRQFLSDYFSRAEGEFFECTKDEGERAFLHRFAAAGAANRYRAIHAHEVEDILALDIALRRNDPNWLESLPPDMDKSILIKLYYGHFLCHVFHQDYIVKKGHDCTKLEQRMWKMLDQRGAEYPAEHNVGHRYYAKRPLREHYMHLDPCNCFNPGIGHTSKNRMYAEKKALPTDSDAELLKRSSSL
ncbi:D-lactate dehydrogenase [Dyella flagellata]|uniref:D-lactate dehydrogenase n=2 Tax=Dyella flagellata TaxID=1867833 RepID=A0ABQ5XDR8_9GAMM|nr:D-lactate dehydrogenase [Dyella flagellata]